MARSKKSGIASLWIWALLLGGGFLVYRFQQRGTLLDQASAAGKINAAVDDALSAQGIKDSQIIESLRIERRRKFPLPKTWIETERHFSGVSAPAAEKIYSVLKKSSQELKLDLVGKEAAAGRTVIELGRGGAIYQRLVFERGKRSERKQIAIVIDDVAGRPGDLPRLAAFLELGIPITFALLPMQLDTARTAAEIHRAGHEIILHQPMEPQNSKGNPPGKAALLTSMSAGEIKKRLEANLADVPHAAGFSNHMGSEFTSNEHSMEALISSAKDLRRHYPNLYFFDSHTTRRPLSPRIAEKKAVPYLVNDLFLDNSDNLKDMANQLDTTKSIALRRGRAIAIGHIQRKHMAEALRRAIPAFKKEGIQFVKLSELLP